MILECLDWAHVGQMATPLVRALQNAPQTSPEPLEPDGTLHFPKTEQVQSLTGSSTVQLPPSQTQVARYIQSGGNKGTLVSLLLPYPMALVGVDVRTDRSNQTPRACPLITPGWPLLCHRWVVKQSGIYSRYTRNTVD